MIGCRQVSVEASNRSMFCSVMRPSARNSASSVTSGMSQRLYDSEPDKIIARELRRDDRTLEQVFRELTEHGEAAA